MRIFKNKNVLKWLSIFGVSGMLAIMGVSQVYGSNEEENDGIVVSCEYNWTEIFFEGKLWLEKSYSTINGDSVMGIFLEGSNFNIVWVQLRSNDIGSCYSKNFEISGSPMLKVSEDGNELERSVISCPFSGYISFFKIIDDEDSIDEWKYVLVPTRCADPNNPYGVFTGEGITEWSVLFKVDDVKPLALSYDGSSLMEGEIAVVDANGNVVSKPVGDLIVEATAPDWQPQFVDIALLQLKNISYLTDQLISQDSNFDITDILTPRALNWYQQLLTKIRFDTRLAMADDIYQPVTLKDIGILAQIQDGLLKRLALGTTASIDISHDPYDPLDNYTLTEIQNILKTDLVLAKSLINSNFAQLTGYDSLSGEDWYQDYDSLVRIWKWEISNDTSFSIWFDQWLRKNNIDYLKGQADVENFNLLGIYNSYYEILQAIKGNEYANILVDIKSNPTSFSDRFNQLGNLVIKESDEVGIYPPAIVMDRVCRVIKNHEFPMGDLMNAVCNAP